MRDIKLFSLKMSKIKNIPKKVFFVIKKNSTFVRKLNKETMRALPVILNGYLSNREYFLFFCFVSFPFLVFLYVFNDLFKCCKTICFPFSIHNEACYVWGVTTYIAWGYPAKWQTEINKENRFLYNKHWINDSVNGSVNRQHKNIMYIRCWNNNENANSHRK